MVGAAGEIPANDELLPMMDRDLDPVGAPESGPVKTSFPLHDHAFEAHERTGFHQTPAPLGGEPLREFHRFSLEGRLQLPKDSLPILKGSVEERTAVHVQAIEDHVAEMAWEFSIPRTEALLECLEVRLSLLVDYDDLPIEDERCGESPEIIGNGTEEFSERVAVAGEESHGALTYGRDHPEAVPFGLVSSIGRRKYGIGLLEEHGGRLARERIVASLVQTKAGEGTGNGLGEHRS